MNIAISPRLRPVYRESTAVPSLAPWLRAPWLRPSFGNRSAPHTSCGGTADILREIARRPAKGALHAVGQAAVAPIQHGREQEVYQPDVVFWQTDRAHPFRISIGRGLDKTDFATGRVGDFGDGLGKGHQPWTAHFVDLPGMTIFSERRHDNIGDIRGVDEGLQHAADGQHNLAALDRVGQEALAEILVEPARSHNGPFGARVLNDLLTDLRLLFAATGKQHQPPDSARHSLPGKGADRLVRAGDG
ncbi:MAG: hypothetical protein IPK19_10345 [Chloroflexi bacterium]|nr:hypothetical protein [Chloroflexota bacterium]